MAGVVTMNYRGYGHPPPASNWLERFFDPWDGPLSTRFAATFVLVAGIGVTLLTRSAIGDQTRVSELRWKLVRRGLVLYCFGMVFDFIWPGTILPYYGAMFVVAAGLFTLRSASITIVGCVAALAGWGTNWAVYERLTTDRKTPWLTSPGPRSPTGLVLNVFVNGTHPLLPWLVFLCAGMILGRVMHHPRWRRIAATAGVTAFAVAAVVNTFASGPLSRAVLSTDPFDRGIVYVASALGTAVFAFTIISWLAERFATTRSIDILRRAGEMSLSIYIAHALVFNLLVDWFQLFQPSGLLVVLSFAATFWVVAVPAGFALQKRLGRGPAERLYRRLAG